MYFLEAAEQLLVKKNAISLRSFLRIVREEWPVNCRNFETHRSGGRMARNAWKYMVNLLEAQVYSAKPASWWRIFASLANESAELLSYCLTCQTEFRASIVVVQEKVQQVPELSWM